MPDTDCALDDDDASERQRYVIDELADALEAAVRQASESWTTSPESQAPVARPRSSTARMTARAHRR